MLQQGKKTSVLNSINVFDQQRVYLNFKTCTKNMDLIISQP